MKIKSRADDDLPLEKGITINNIILCKKIIFEEKHRLG